MQITTRVMQTGPAQFSQVGQLLGYSLKDLAAEVSSGLAQRLVSFASKRFAEAGFGPAIAGAEVEVYTLDGEYRPSDRAYNVKFKQKQGGYVELCRILMTNGWPSLDHGFAIGDE